MDNLMNKIVWGVTDFFYGRFNGRTLKKKCRVWWQRFWIAVFVLLILWGMFLLLEWWSGVVRTLNYVIWG